MKYIEKNKYLEKKKNYVHFFIIYKKSREFSLNN